MEILPLFAFRNVGRMKDAGHRFREPSIRNSFWVKENNGWKLRWFTPGGEIDLCGHATLATAFVLMNFVEPDLSEIEFSILSGKLSVKKKNELYEMDFPPYELKRVEVTEAMENAIGFKPLEAWIGRD